MLNQTPSMNSTLSVVVAFFIVILFTAWLVHSGIIDTILRLERLIRESPDKLDTIMATIPKEKRNTRTRLGFWYQIYKAYKRMK